MSSPTMQSLGDENRLLQNELNRVEDMLATSRAERDEIYSKYSAVSERVSTIILVDV